MAALSTTAWWAVAFAVGGAVVVVAAALLITIILLARRIVHQAAEITLALDGAMRNTNPLFDVASVNHSVESIARALKEIRGESQSGGGEDERGLVERAQSRLTAGGRDG